MTTNVGFKGFDVRQTGTALVFRAGLTASSAVLATGTTSLRLYELQSDGTLKSYDFASNTFKTTALTTETAALNHQTGNNATTNTGVWTYVLATLTGFTVGAVYIAMVTNSGADAQVQWREFQYGSEQGDLVVTASGTTGQGWLDGNLKAVLGTLYAGAAGYLIDWSKVANQSGSVALVNTYISGGNQFIPPLGWLGNGSVTSATSTTVTLSANYTGGDIGATITITSGTGAGQQRTITAYNSSTHVVTVDRAWHTTPDSTSYYYIGYSDSPALDGSLNVSTTGGSSPTAAQVATAVWQDLLSSSDFSTAGSAGALGKTLTASPTAATIITALWQDLLTSSDFSTSGSIGAALKAYLASPADTSGTATLLSRLTSARAGYMDNLNISGAVASHSDITSINQSASKHVIMNTVQQYAPGGAYTIEARTFSAADGSSVNADSTPTLTATGAVSGSLAANLGSATNPATGVYRWTYTVPSTPTLEQIRFDLSATIAGVTFTMSSLTQTVDAPTAQFTSTDKSNLTAIFNKLPTNNIADETVVLAALPAVDSSGRVILQPTQTGVTIPTVTNLTNAPTAGDFTAAMKNSLNASTPASVGAVTSTVNASLVAILGTALTETVTGYLAAAFKKFFNVTTPTSTMNEITLVDTITTYTGNTPQTGDVYAQVGVAGANLTAVTGVGIDWSKISNPTALVALPNTTIASSVIMVNGPTAYSSDTGLVLSIAAGDDYSATDGRQIDLLLNSADIPALTGASVYLICLLPRTAQIKIAGSVITATGTTKQIRFQPTHSQTALLGPVTSPIYGQFWVRIVTAGGDTISPQEVAGQLIVTPGANSNEITA